MRRLFSSIAGSCTDSCAKDGADNHSSNKSIKMSDPKQILAKTSWFTNEALQDALSTKMNRLEVEDGHIFFWESRPVDAILIIEEGTLKRTKALDHEELVSIINEPISAKDVSINTSNRSLPTVDDDKWSIQVDQISGLGKVTGLLHVLNQEYGDAYATVKSCGKAVVWMIPAKDFLDVLSTDSAFAMDMLSKAAYKMRAGSKSLKKLIRNTKKTVKKSPSVIEESGGTNTSIVRVLCYDSTEWVQPSFKPAVDAFNKEFDPHGCSIEMDYTNDRLSEQTATYSAG